MTVLLTYPRTRVPDDLYGRLERAATAVVCLPLRDLRPVEVDDAQRRAMRGAARLVITSRFALDVYLGRHWSPDWQGTLIVLSAAMAMRARAAGMRDVLVPPEENQRSLAELLAEEGGDGAARSGDDASAARGAERDGTAPAAVRGETVVLCGDVALPHDWLPASLPRIPIYGNHWDDDARRRAVDTLRADCGSSAGAGPIDRILVTSPSAYRRLKPIIAAAPRCFVPSPTYYALGPSTAAEVAADGGMAIAPREHTDVLRRVIERIIADETAARDRHRPTQQPPRS